MSPHDIATKADLTALADRLTALIEKVLPALAATDDFLDVKGVADLTGVSQKTVRKWIAEGKYDQEGHRIKLFILEFSPGYPRVPRSALVAYGKGQGFDSSQFQSAIG